VGRPRSHRLQRRAQERGEDGHSTHQFVEAVRDDQMSRGRRSIQDDDDGDKARQSWRCQLQNRPHHRTPAPRREALTAMAAILVTRPSQPSHGCSLAHDGSAGHGWLVSATNELVNRPTPLGLSSAAVRHCLDRPFICKVGLRVAALPIPSPASCAAQRCHRARDESGGARVCSTATRVRPITARLALATRRWSWRRPLQRP
jgi:hypothetical protein